MKAHGWTGRSARTDGGVVAAHSRRDLVAKVFFSHYEGRLRDNEQRAATQLPLRGGPMPRPVDDPVTPAGAGPDR